MFACQGTQAISICQCRPMRTCDEKQLQAPDSINGMQLLKNAYTHVACADLILCMQAAKEKQSLTQIPPRINGLETPDTAKDVSWPDLILCMQAAKEKQSLTQIDPRSNGLETPSGMTTNLTEIGAGRRTMVGINLDRMADSVRQALGLGLMV